MGVADQLQARPTDPRDITWEVDRPTYHVHFWHQPEPEAHHHPMGWVSDEWVVECADVDQVVRWANENANDRSFVLYAAVTDSEGPGLIRLLGADPTVPAK
jgi:hypothetical protein